MTMKQFHLPQELNISVVDGIIEGYKDYLSVRREKARELKVHGAYAWVKGNHIDHHVAMECEKHGVTGRLSKAGLTWQYLQFQLKDDKVLFLVKNARYFDPYAVDKGKDAKGRTRSNKASFMANLTNINSSIEFPEVIPPHQIGQSTQLQLELLEDMQVVQINSKDTLEISKQYDRFYIVTYEVDSAFLIREIKVWMPNPVNNKAYLVENLSKYINTKPSHIIEMENDTRAILQSSAEIEVEYDATAYEIVFDDAEEKKS
ncbi:hypothetical protein J2Z40_002130 [Cytobacillus eiseniae]|uniref:Uncharacterized protein n=1 Tax=Cytobacillus eiseniae TaxID=762947 RepID=A0ABS4RF96_9BACI|nr:hypothetical protein [Cytobacillus eiseniae]MBP2241567.1 hypothetical protein [Cytobacillus eiseniae]